eukprot:14404252-Alexandrium_andersonii.AAC.1
MAAAGTSLTLIRRTREILDMPFEVSYALDAGLRTEGITDLDSLEAAIWRGRARGTPAAGTLARFP